MTVPALPPEIYAALTEGKYRALNLPPETLADLWAQERPRCKNDKEAVKAVKRKLHNIVAPYLGDPDYPAAAAELDEAFASGDEAVRAVCLRLLGMHASTRERLEHLEAFYQTIWTVTGAPSRLLDLACGLNPLGMRWMGLPEGCEYHAYDLHQPRVELLNHYFRLEGRPGLAECGDILVRPPQLSADVALFLKEAHRFEQRQKGCNRRFWQALNVRWLVVSLPGRSLTGRHDLLDGQRRLVAAAVAGLDWPVTERAVGDEILFLIEKPV
jgi:16S rRNA (guanine(1405)-N(7))-methyltransferase